jgi:hypothetical protein
MREQERQLREEIDGLLERAQQQDGEEDEPYREDRRGDELPQELRRREDRLAAIEAAKQRLEAAFPGLTANRTNLPDRSTKAIILVVSPPRLLPIAWTEDTTARCSVVPSAVLMRVITRPGGTPVTRTLSGMPWRTPRST